MKRKFSSGLPKLDAFVGGFLPGDTFLTVFTQYKFWSHIVARAIQYGIQQNYPITYVSGTEYFASALSGYKKFHPFHIDNSGRSPQQVLRALRKDLRSYGKNSVIILDELSTWKNCLGPGPHVGDLFDIVADMSGDLNSFVVASAVRNGLGPDFITHCKDTASVAIDIATHDGDGYCMLLAARGRYTFNAGIPLRIRNSELAKKAAGQGDRPHGAAPEKQFSQFLHAALQNNDPASLFGRSSQPMAMMSQSSDFREFNAAAVELLGRSPEELRAAKLTELVAPNEKTRFLRFVSEIRKRGKASGVFAVGGGHKPELTIEIRCSALGNGAILVLGQDTPDRASFSLAGGGKSLQSLLDGTSASIAVLDRGKLRYANSGFMELTGHSNTGEIRTKALKELFPLASVKLLNAAVRGSEEQGIPQSLEIQVLRPDGSLKDCAARISPVAMEGRTCHQLTLIDISEHKRAITALQGSLEKFRAIVERSMHASALSRSGQVEFTNAAFAELFGFDSPPKETGLEITGLLQEADREKFTQFLTNKNRKQQGTASFSGTGIRRDASLFDLEISLAPAGIDNLSVTFFRDVSREKKLRLDLERHLQDLSALDAIYEAFSSSADLHALINRGMHTTMSVLKWEIGACYIIDTAGKELRLAYQKGLTEGYLKKMEALSLEEGIGGFLFKTQETISFSTRKYPSYLPHRSAFDALSAKSICLLPLVSKDKFIGCIVLCSKHEFPGDRHPQELLKAISTQVGSLLGTAIAFQRLKEIQERQQLLMDSVPEIMYTASPKSEMQFVSKPVEPLTGHSPREFYKNPSLWLNLVHPDDKRILLERTAQLDSHEAGSETEYRIIPKGKATPRWVRDVASVARDAQGHATALHGSITDITQTKEIVGELQSIHHLDGDILSSIREGIVVCDRSMKCLHWNRPMEILTGIPSADAMGKSLSSFFSSVEPQELKKLAHEVMGGETVTTPDHLYVHPDSNKETFLSGRYSPLQTPDGDCIGMIGVVTNVGNRKKLEGEMRESEQILRNVIDTMGDVLLITDLKGNVMEINQTFLRTLGYSRADITGQEFPYPWLLDEEMGRFVLWIAELRDKNWLHDFDMTWKAKDGHLIPMSLSTTLLRNSMGEPVAMLNIARDITERTKLAKDLANRNIQIEMINRVVNKANQTMDFDEIFHAIAEEIDAVVPCDSINVGLLSEDGSALAVYSLKGTEALQKGDSVPIDQTVSRFAFEAKRPVIINDLGDDSRYKSLRSHHRGLKSQISIPIILKDQPFGALNIASKDSHRYTEDHIQLLQPLAQQIGTIVDRVQLFQQVTDDSTYIHNLLDSIDSIVYTVDHQYRIREVNQAWHAYMQESGFPGIRNYQGTNLFEVLPNDSLKNMFRGIIDHLIDGSVRIFSQEFVSPSRDGDRTYQITINPMVIERKIKGLVFTHTDITTLKKAEAELKKSYDQLLVLNEISTVINTSLDLNEILQAAIPLLKKDMHADAILVFLLDQSEIVLAKQLGFEGIDSTSFRRLQRGNSVTGSVIHSKEPLYISENVSLDERIIPQNREVLKKSDLQAIAVIPLTSKDKVLGALDVFYGEAHHFTEQERQIFSLLGNQLGTAIENAQLYGELRSQIGRLTVLYELSQQLTSTLDIDQIFEAIRESVQRVVSFETFNIELYDSTLRSLRSAYHVSMFDQQQHVQYDSGVLRTIRPQSPEEHVLSSKRSYHDPEKSSIFVPMLSKETIIGMMSVMGSSGEQYTETHLRLLESIGNLVAIALEKAKLYEETVKISLEIQRRNKELDDFTYVVSHDLKEPLISIEGYSRILQLDYRDMIEGDGKEYLDSIVGATTRMKGLIDDLLMLSRVSRPAEVSKPVSIEAMIRDIQTDMEFKVKQKGVTFVLPHEIPVIHGNEMQLKVVFRNLIGNAVKFNNKPNPLVEIGFQNSENNSYLFFVKDNGIGIPKEFFDKIFVIFQRLHRREEYEGSGAGLAIVKKIIEMHKGKIWVESEMDKGTTFFFTIPKPE
ncbi:MAG TPA: PAS domain S-box protein [Bacteroidota bacterium]|jgi:PAS domain S-box-containing protein|nr:PAS domain S-box protein [Bacteroidota bacterium]